MTASTAPNETGWGRGASAPIEAGKIVAAERMMKIKAAVEGF
jgi:hypothetical protein